jgi:PHD/YefM family antitoxin component YafN of YafNO toxin-antitoxin module
MDIMAIMSTPPDPLGELRAVPATDVKTRGWRGVMRLLDEQGTLVVTNHDEPQAVIVAVREYEKLLESARQADARKASELDALRQDFDSRLAALRRKGAGDRLRAVMRRPAKLKGKVKAGTGY